MIPSIDPTYIQTTLDSGRMCAAAAWIREGGSRDDRGNTECPMVRDKTRPRTRVIGGSQFGPNAKSETTMPRQRRIYLAKAPDDSLIGALITHGKKLIGFIVGKDRIGTFKTARACAMSNILLSLGSLNGLPIMRLATVPLAEPYNCLPTFLNDASFFPVHAKHGHDLPLPSGCNVLRLWIGGGKAHFQGMARFVGRIGRDTKTITANRPKLQVRPRQEKSPEAKIQKAA